LFNTKRNEHYFCKHCGVRSFGIGNAPDACRVYGVNLGCLEDVTPEELAAGPIIYVDGSTTTGIRHQPSPVICKGLTIR
jgi:hypothetical protein